MGPVVPVFMNLHAKCSIFSAKDYEDAESHILYRNDWKNLQGLAEDAKCGRFALNLDVNGCLLYDSLTLVGNDWNNL